MDNVLPLSLAQCADIFIAAIILGFASTIATLVQSNNERVANIERQNYYMQSFIYDSKFDGTTVYAQDIVAAILQTREEKSFCLDGTIYTSSTLRRMGVDEILALVNNEKTYEANLWYEDMATFERTSNGFEVTGVNENGSQTGEVVGYIINTKS